MIRLAGWLKHCNLSLSLSQLMAVSACHVNHTAWHTTVQLASLFGSLQGSCLAVKSLLIVLALVQGCNAWAHVIKYTRAAISVSQYESDNKQSSYVPGYKRYAHTSGWCHYMLACKYDNMAFLLIDSTAKLHAYPDAAPSQTVM